MSLTIRRAVPEDAPELARVAAATFGLACPQHTTQESMDMFVRDVLSERSFDSCLADHDRVLLLAEGADEGSEPIADAPADDAARWALGYTMVVLGQPQDADARAAINQLNVRAIRFYEKSGFARVGEKRFQVGTGLEHDVVLEVQL